MSSLSSTRTNASNDELHDATVAAAAGQRAPVLDTDPFHELRGAHVELHRQVLGGRFHFRSNSRALIELVEAAYGGLPAHHLPPASPEFRVELRLVSRRETLQLDEPPPVRTQSGAGLLCGVMDAFNYVIIEPGQHRALIVVSQDMLERAYHVRYELIEFAVFILATRVLGFVPLHGACVGTQGRGVLLLGASGSGKSTVALHSLLHGLDFLAEDAVFVQPQSLFATGVANFVHVRADSIGFIDDRAQRGWIADAPVIRRRSGVEKHEADLRRGPGQLALHPLQLIGAVFVSPLPAEPRDALLRRVDDADVTLRLMTDQPYAASQPGWHHFSHQLIQLGVHELRRGRHPREAVDALRQLLDARHPA
jgi:hypothetical protein